MSSVLYCSCAQFANSDVSDVSVVRQEVSPFNEHSESYNNHQEHDQYLGLRAVRYSDRAACATLNVTVLCRDHEELSGR